MTNDKLRQLLAEMSLDEKIDQLLQLNGSFYEGEGVITGPMSEMGIEERNVNCAGSILGSVGAEAIMKIQDAYMKKQPHQIPMLFMADIINGYRTVFPIPLAQGCSFSPELSKECARITALESAKAGLHVTFAPMVDLVRDARWGRVMESTGEDTYLNSCFAKALVEGLQGDDLADKNTIASCIKHFAAYGEPMGGRDYNHVELSERTLRDSFLPAYEAGIKAGSALMMTSFNTLDRVPCTGNKWLMRDILRKEMGFEGVLISDWAAIQELIYNGLCEDKEEAAKLALECGVDIDMMTDCYTNYLKLLVEKGEIQESLIDESVWRVLELKNKLGLFENPHKGADIIFDTKEEIEQLHREAAKKAAVESFVLLKNDGILPLSTEDKVAFVGPYVSDKKLHGAWSFFNKESETVSLEEGILNYLKTTEQAENASFYKGCECLNDGEEVIGFRTVSINETSKDKALVDKAEIEKAEAIRAAKEAKIVVMAIGEHREYTGEGGSRTDIKIPEIQMELFREIYKVNANIVVVLFNGRPLDLSEISDKALAILDVWMPGTEGGSAIAEVLYGKISPSGRLSMSFPRNVGQVPIFYNEFHTGRRYEEGSRARFVSRYMDTPNTPLYPFGYGLSYGEFEYSEISLDKTEMKHGESIRASVQVRNIGKMEAKEVVQLYIRDVVGSVVRPIRELKGFEKIKLQPGEGKEVTFLITEDMLAFHGIDMKYAAETGKFEIFLGHDSDTKNKAEFQLV